MQELIESHREAMHENAPIAVMRIRFVYVLWKAQNEVTSRWIPGIES